MPKDERTPAKKRGSPKKVAPKASKKSTRGSSTSLRLGNSAFDAGNYDEAIEHYGQVKVGTKAYSEAQRRTSEAQMLLLVQQWKDARNRDQEDEALVLARGALDLAQRLQENNGDHRAVRFLIEEALDFGKWLQSHSRYLDAQGIFATLQKLDPENKEVSCQLDMTRGALEAHYKSKARIEQTKDVKFEEGDDIEPIIRDLNKTIKECERILETNLLDEEAISRARHAEDVIWELTAGMTRRQMGHAKAALRRHDYKWAAIFFQRVLDINDGEHGQAKLKLEEATEKRDNTAEVRSSIAEGLRALEELDHRSAVNQFTSAKSVALDAGLKHLTKKIDSHLERAQLVAKHLGEAELAMGDEKYEVAKQSYEAVWKEVPECQSELEPQLKKARTGRARKLAAEKRAQKRKDQDQELIKQAQHLRDLAGIEASYEETIKELKKLGKGVSRSQRGAVEELVREMDKEHAEKITEEKARREHARHETLGLVSEATSALEDEKDPDKAIAVARSVLGRSPGSKRAKSLLCRATKYKGQRAFASGDYGTAREELQIVIELDKSDKDATELLAQIEGSQATVSRAEVLFEQGKFGEALDLLGQAGPNMAAKRLLRTVGRAKSQFDDGRESLKHGDLEIAISLLEKTRRSVPHSEEVIAELGRARFQRYFQAGQEAYNEGLYGEAVRNLKLALRHNPTDRRATDLLKNAEDLKKGRDRRVKELLEEVERSLEAGDFRTAIEKAQEAVDKHPASKKAKKILANAKRKRKAEQKQEIERHIEEGQRLEAQGRFEDALIRYEDILAEFEELDRASERIVADAIERITGIVDLLGSAREAMQDPYRSEEAKGLLAAALELAPDNEIISRLLKQVSLRKDDMDQISQQLEAAEAARQERDFAEARHRYSSARNLAGTLGGVDELLKRIQGLLAELNAEETRIAEAAEFHRRGQEAMESGRYAEAVTYLESAHERDSDNAEITGLLEEARQRKETRDKVAKVLKVAREHLDGRKFGTAIDRVEEALRLDPDDTEAKQLKVDAQDRLAKDRTVVKAVSKAENALSQYDWEQALRYVKEAEGIDEDRPDLSDLRTEVEQAKRRIQAVVENCRRGVYFEEKGKHRKAEEHYERVLELDPDGKIVAALGLDLEEFIRAKEEAEEGEGELFGFLRRRFRRERGE